LQPPPRHPALDAARGVAVLAVVLSHALLALLSPSARREVWDQPAWEPRGITTALFLLVCGWAMVAALDHRPASARSAYGRHVGRALLLIFVGYLLRWPGWEVVRALGWSEALQARLFGFDALQCIGVSLVVGATVLALARGSRSRTVALGVLAVGLPLASPMAWQLGVQVPMGLRQAIGVEGSPFPLFPWAGFFFAGALVAWLSRLLQPGWPQGLALAVLGAGLLGVTSRFPQDWGPASAWLVAFRVGQGLLVLAAVSCIPVRLSRLFAPLGRLSLWVYVLHLPVLYGWAGTQGLAERVGPTLTLGLALLAGLGLLVACYVVARVVRWLRRLALPWKSAHHGGFRRRTSGWEAAGPGRAG
jgi:peptidoglycan/LPS O-acetylase OafA/YrhL